MATQPSDTPRWYTASGAPSPTAPFTGSNAPPSAPKQTAGWDANEAIPNTWLNWLFFYIWAWIYYFKTDINTGRDPTVGYGFDPVGTFVQSFAVGSFHQWFVDPALATTATLFCDATHGWITASNTDTVDAVVPLAFDKNSDISGSLATITTMACRYTRDASGTVSVAILRRSRTGTGAYSAVHSMTLATGSDSTVTETATGGLPHTVDRDYEYVLAVTVNPNAAGGSSADTYIKWVNVTHTRSRVL